MYLKWLNAEHIYVTSAGRLQVGGLSGASYANHTTSSFKVLNGTANRTTNGTGSSGTGTSGGGAVEGAGGEEEGLSITLLSEQLSALRSQRGDSSLHNTPSTDKSHRVKA